MARNRFRSTTFAEAGQAIGGIGTALRVLKERDALEAETQRFSEFASQLNQLSLGDDPQAFDSLLLQGATGFKNLAIRNTLFQMTKIVKRPLTKEQKDRDKELAELKAKERERDLLETTGEIKKLKFEESPEGKAKKEQTEKKNKTLVLTIYLGVLI